MFENDYGQHKGESGRPATTSALEISMFETPSAQQAEDFKHRFLKAGLSELSFEEMFKIAETYDRLR